MSGVHVCGGTGRYYTAEARPRGARKYVSVGIKVRTAHGAARELATTMLQRGYSHGRVWGWDDWYGAHEVLELRTP